MEFDFQKKTTHFVLDQLMSSRHRNANEVRAMTASPDFHQPTLNPQVLISNPHMEPNHFNSIADFQSPHNSSQIPQFMFDQEECPSNEDSFLPSHNVSGRKDDLDKPGFFQRKSFPQMDQYFEAPSPVGTTHSPPNDYQIPSRFNQHSFQLQNKLPAIDKENNQCSQSSKVKPATSEIFSQNAERQIRHNLVSDPVQNTNVSCLDSIKAEKNESFSDVQVDLHDFSKSYEKLSLEKAELVKQVANNELSLKEYKKKATSFENKYKEMKEKLIAEVENRENVLSQVEYMVNDSQMLQKHVNDVSNKLKLYENVNSEYKEHNSKLHDHMQTVGKEYKSVLASYKVKNEKLKSQVLIKDRNLLETSTEFVKAKDTLTLKIDEANRKLGVEQEKSSILEKKSLAFEQLNKELALKQEQRENSFSEKYTSLQTIFQDMKNKFETLQKEYGEIKIYEIKYQESEKFITKIQEEKEALSNILNASQQNLSKSEIERSENLKCIEKLHLEKEEANEIVSKIKDECADVNLKLRDETACHIHLTKENEELKRRYQTMCEDMEVLKTKNMDLEDEIKKANVTTVMHENTIKEAKEQLNCLQREVFIADQEVQSKAKNVESLEEQLSHTILQNEQLLKTEEELREMVNEKERLVIELQTSNTSLENDLEKEKESNKLLEEELVHTKEEIAKTREEMITNVDQYREQYMNELKDTEQKINELQHKYKNTTEDLEKIVEQKKESDMEISDLQQSIKRYEKKTLEKDDTIIELRQELEKEQKLAKKKENELNEKFTKIKDALSDLREEKHTLERAMEDMKIESNSNEMTHEKIVSLEKQINIMQQENTDLREKLKTTENPSARGITPSQETETLKFPGSLPVPRKRVCFDDEFFSDTSSIDLPAFFNRKEIPKSVASSRTSYKFGDNTLTTPAAKTDNTKGRRTQKRNLSQSKKFFKKSTAENDTNIFG